MADILLAKPAAGASQTIPCAPEARFVFDFPTTDATLARDGDDLAIRFEDGSSLNLEGFYTEYNEENLPSFSIDGTEVAAADFFAAMNEPDLMPAAGPGAGTTPTGGRFHEWGNADLADGIDHLNGLDWGFSRSFEWTDQPNAVGGGDDGGLAVNTVPGVDVPVPGEPSPEPPTPENPENPGGPFIPNTNGAAIVVDEGALAQAGSGQHTAHGASGQGLFVADVHGEAGGTIELAFGGKTVTLEIPRDGTTSIDIPADATFTVNGVEIAIRGAVSDGNGKWTVSYDYALGGAVDHDRESGEDLVKFDADGIAIRVTDGSGDVAEGRLTVEVHDDAPTIDVIASESPWLVQEGSFTLSYGADGAADTDALTATIGDTGYTATKTDEGAFIFDIGGDRLTVTPGDGNSYTYAYQRAEPAEGEVKTSWGHDITFTATDSDDDSASATVTVGQNVPSITPDPDLVDPGLVVGKIEVDEGSQPEHEAASHGKTDSGVFSVDLHGEDGTISIGGAVFTIKDGVVQESGDQTVFVLGNALTLSAPVWDAASGTWSIEYSYTAETAQDHGGEGSPQDGTLAAEIPVSVTGASGGTASGVLQVELHDDVPTITTGEYSSHPITDPTPQISFDFRAEDFSGFTTGSNLNGNGYSRLEQGSVQIFASNVRYSYADDGSRVVDQVYDENGKSLDGSYSNKHLSISEDGLGVGNSWGGDDLAMQGAESNLSEALVLETKNGSVSYGMNLEFGRFEEGDKALITFMLTPRNNNDDTVVLMKEISFSDLKDGKIFLDVPDGFTKVFISALPGEEGHDSSFTVKTLEMTRPSWEHEGSFTIAPGADGVADADNDGIPDSFSWDVDLSNFGTPPSVHVTGAPGSGDYTLVREQGGDPNVMIFKLSGQPNGQNGTNLDGNALFIVRVDPATGTWTVDQFYTFDLPNGKSPTFDLKFEVTDGDGDVAHASQTVDAGLDSPLDRFQNVVDDTFNGADTKTDTNASILTGTEANDLMYGRGGDDILFGDAGENFAAKLYNELTLWGKPADPNWISPDTGESQVWIRLNNSKPNAQEQNGLHLENILSNLERHEGNGGDDALFGGLGNDILFGGAGNDYLYGNGKNKEDATVKFTDRDMLFGGSGNDILVYDGNDAIIHGGSDTDILLAGKDAPSLAEMLDEGNGSGDRPYVGGIEILLRSMDTTHVENLGITSLKTLKNYGIEIENNMLILGAAWSQIANIGGNLAFECTLEDGSTLRLETTLDGTEVGGAYKPLPPADAAAQTAADGADDAVVAALGAEHAAAQPGADTEVADLASGEDAAPLQAMRVQSVEPTREDAGDSAAAGHAEASLASRATAHDASPAQAEEASAPADGLLFGEDASAEIYASASDDLIVYDASDYLIDGGEGIDFLLAGADAEHSLADMLGNWEQHGADKEMPMVHDVEVMLKGIDTSLQNMDTLAERYGFSMGRDENGRDILILGDQWQKVEGSDNGTTTTYENGEGVTLETTLAVDTTSAEDHAVQAAANELATSNG